MKTTKIIPSISHTISQVITLLINNNKIIQGILPFNDECIYHGLIAISPFPDYRTDFWCCH